MIRASTETQAGHRQIQIIELNIEVVIRWLVYLIFRIKKGFCMGVLIMLAITGTGLVVVFAFGLLILKAIANVFR